MKNFSTGIVGVLLLAFAMPVFASVPPSPVPTLSSQDIATLTKPSVVLVDNRTDEIFQTDIPSLNLDQMTITSVAKKGTKAQDFDESIPSDKQLGLRMFDLTGSEGSGSGFIINSDGYIVTNAHVASAKSDEYEVLDSVASSLIDGVDTDTTTPFAYDRLSDSAQSDFHDQVLQYLISNVTVVSSKSTLTVLNPSVVGKSMDDAVAAGFPATIVKVNDNYPLDGKDIALIKIDQENLPSLALGTSDNTGTGSDVYVFGFPATATISTTDVSQATFSRGVINAIKQDGPHHVPVYQTDAKISSGSSGSPMLDQYGNVIGMVTYGTSADGEDENGDGFGYALPISLVTDFLQDTNVVPAQGAYYTDVLQGINDMHAQKYQHALAAFALTDDVNNINPSFVSASYLDQYLATAKSMIAAGLSQDTLWEQFRALVLAHLLLSLFAVLFILLLIANFVGDGFLHKRLILDEKKIDKIESEIEKKNDPVPPNPPKTDSRV